METQGTLTIVNQRGLHARASRKLAELAQRFDAQILVRRDDLEVDACAMMDLMMLAAGQGSQIEVLADGPDAVAAFSAISELVANRFGEES